MSVSSEQIKAQGTTRIEDLTNQLPQVFAAQAGEVSNGSTGTAQLSLRGLGAERILVLIDGRRLPYGSSISSPANLDLIPTQMIEKIDILTGGASAFYGSDAVGGVANFVLRRDFEGVELDFQGNFQQSGNNSRFYRSVLETAQQPVPGSTVDGEEYSITGMIGTNTADGRGNVTIYANYEKRRAVTQNNRVFSACTIGESSSGFEGAGCVGSGNFRLFSSDESTIVDQSGDSVLDLFQQEDGTLIPFAGGPTQTYNFGARNFFQRPSERYTLYGRGYYELTDNLEIFADISYTDVISDAQIAETASFGGIYSINCDNPYLAGSDIQVDGQSYTYYDFLNCSAQDIADGGIKNNITASHRNVEGGPRNSRLENSAFRVVAGLDGSFADDVWRYEIFGQYAETSDTSISSNDFVISKLQQAFLAVDDGNGNVVCFDPSGGCVPYNPFQRNADGSTAITTDQTDFIQGVGIVVGETTQRVVGANIQGDLDHYGIASPWADDGVGLLVGIEHRRDTLDSIPDEISQVPGGGFTGVGGATLPVSGQVKVFEIYSELQVPLIQDCPGFHELTVKGAYRYSDYDANGNNTTNTFSTDAYGVELTRSPIEDVTFRAQYQRSVRAPNVIELYTGQDTGLPNLNSAQNSMGQQIFDPCATSAPTASLEACMRTGVTAAQYGNISDVISGQTQSITGGNPDLEPESSDTYTFGVVLTPSFVPGLSISVDYFDITVDGFISAGINAQTTLDQCLATGDAAFCDLITRSPSGNLRAGLPGVGFDAFNINIAEVNTAGIDVQVNYRTDVGSLGTLHFNYAATYLDKNDFVPFPGGDPIDCAGFLNNGCIQPVNPDYRHITSATLDTPFGLDATVTWRYFAGTKNEAAAGSPQIDDDLPSVNYIDLSFFYELNDGINLRAGILNVFDELPPVSTSSGPPLGNGNTFPTIYDTARTFFGGVNFKF